VQKQGQGAAPSSQDSIVFDGMPEIGITINDELKPEELEPHFFSPNFIRPVPTAEFDPEFDEDLDAEYDISKDAIYMVPGMLPEPYWDLNMVQEQFNYA